MAMIQTSRGFTPPKGPIGSLGMIGNAMGMIGNAMNVIAASTSTDRNSGQLMLRTQPCSRSREASNTAVATAAA
jgi:hypothetical protein